MGTTRSGIAGLADTVGVTLPKNPGLRGITEKGFKASDSPADYKGKQQFHCAVAATCCAASHLFSSASSHCEKQRH